MAFLNTDEKSIGLEKILNIFIKIKKDLHRISEIENTIQNSSIFISNDQGFNSYDELEILVKSEIKLYKNDQNVINIFKWMLVLFESLSGYLAVGLITHAIVDTSNIPSWILIIIRLIIAISFSFAIVNFAVNSIKTEDGITKWQNYLIAFGSILALPLFNVVMIFIVKLPIEYKEIYAVSLFFTSFTGLLIVLKNKDKSNEKERKMSRIMDLKKLLEERKNKYSESKQKYINMFKENNKYDDVLSSNELNSNPLYSEISKFLIESQNFDEWSNNYIETYKDKSSIIIKLMEDKKINGA